MPTAAERLKQLRKEHGLTLQALEDKTGLSKGYLSDMERGRREPSRSALEALATFYGVSTDYILGRAEGKHSEPFDPSDPDWRSHPNVPDLLLKLDQDPDFDMDDPLNREILMGLAFARMRGQMTKADILEFLGAAKWAVSKLEREKEQEN